MEALIDSIQVALRDGATDDERRRAAVSCRALAELFNPPEPPEPEPTVAALALAPVAVSASLPPTLLPPAVSPFAGMTADQILDLAIAKLRATAGPIDPDKVGKGFRLTLVPVPRVT